MLFFKKIFSNSHSHELPKESLEAVILNTVHKVLIEEIKIYPILNHNEALIKRFFSNGFIRFSTLEENLKKEFLLPELKVILKENDLKVSGKKDDLIERIISNINFENLQNPKSKLKRILLTDKGRELVINENERFSRELEEFYDKVYNLFFLKKFEDAFKLVSTLYENSLRPNGLGKDWSLGFSKIDMQVSILLREFHLDETLLNHGIEEIRSELATYNLFRFNYLGKYKVEDRILKKFPNFESKYIKDYLENEPDGLASNFDSNNQKDVLFLFVHYIQFTCHNEANLTDICTYRDKAKYGFKGVEVVVGGRQDCLKCRQLGSKKYSWQEIKKIPKIPYYPGCICMYLSINESI